MGEVWAARDTQTGLAVCVKLMRVDEEFLPDEQFRALAEDRLRTEGRVLGLLAGHPNVVSCRDAGHTPDGVPFLVLELLAGESMRALLKQKGALSPHEALPLMITLLGTLQWVHEHGIVHRDLKPDNVFLARSDNGQAVVKLLDFGVAKLITETVVQRIAPAHQTAKGTFIGTLRYVSPEQVLLMPVDARSDIYSAGALLFALLTGDSPFAGHKDLVTLTTAMRAEGFDEHLGGQPEGLRRAICKAMAYRPEDRFQTAESFADALEAIGVQAVPVAAGEDAATRIWDRPNRRLPAETAAPSTGAMNSAMPVWLFVLISLVVALAIVGAAILAFHRWVS